MVNIIARWWVAALAVAAGTAAVAAEIRVEHRRAAEPELFETVSRYGSLPGGGQVVLHNRTREADSAAITRRYGSVPGGIVLEGKPSGLSPLKNVRYVAEGSEFHFDGGRSFASRLPPGALAQLARAIDEDDRIGVSITDESVIAFGAVADDSTVVRDLALADIFLADFVIPPREWTLGYRVANGYETAGSDVDADFAVFFRFRNFSFSEADSKIRLASVNIDLYVVPVRDQKASDGGYLVDAEALRNGVASPASQANADHLTKSIDYYMKERIAGRALAYGEAAALFRQLRDEGVDLAKFADELDKVPLTQAEPAWTSIEDAWSSYLKEIQEANDFSNWAMPPYDSLLAQKAQ